MSGEGNGAGSDSPEALALGEGSLGERALAGLDHVLAQQPQKEDATLSEVIKELCRLRDQLIARKTRADATPQDRRRLDHVNAVISVALAVQFPLGDIPWDELGKARAWLSELAVEQA